jgi:hypothetical protein
MLSGDFDATKATAGGQVGAPCGCIGCFNGFDQVQGQWQYSRKKQQGTLHASGFNSLVCGCESCGTDNQLQSKLSGQLCNAKDLECGPGHPAAPANIACFSGTGDYSITPGKTRTVAFRVNVEDRGEPGSGQNATCTSAGKPLTCCTGLGTGECDDVYRIQVYIPNDTENATDLAAAICCTGPGIIPNRPPDIDDGDDLVQGNIQIHPQIASHADTCPVPTGSCVQ